MDHQISSDLQKQGFLKPGLEWLIVQWKLSEAMITFIHSVSHWFSNLRGSSDKPKDKAETCEEHRSMW